MKTLQDRMNAIKTYFRGIEMYNEALMVKVVFPKKWRVYPSKDERIKVTVNDSGTMMYYYADSNNTTYDEIFDLIEETIKTNEDVILKLGLLKDKVEELRELFSRLSYDELKTLKFVTEQVKETKQKRKYNKKKKEEIMEETKEMPNGKEVNDVKEIND